MEVVDVGGSKSGREGGRVREKGGGEGREKRRESMRERERGRASIPPPRKVKRSNISTSISK